MEHYEEYGDTPEEKLGRFFGKVITTILLAFFVYYLISFCSKVYRFFDDIHNISTSINANVTNIQSTNSQVLQ